MRNLKSINELFGIGNKILSYSDKISSKVSKSLNKIVWKHPPNPDNNIAEVLIEILKSSSPDIILQEKKTEEKTKHAIYRTYDYKWKFVICDLPIYFNVYRSSASPCELPRSFSLTTLQSDSYYYLWIEGVYINVDDKILSTLEDLLKTKKTIKGEVQLVKDTSLRGDDELIIKKDILNILQNKE